MAATPSSQKVVGDAPVASPPSHHSGAQSIAPRVLIWQSDRTEMWSVTLCLPQRRRRDIFVAKPIKRLQPRMGRHHRSSSLGTIESATLRLPQAGGLPACSRWLSAATPPESDAINPHPGGVSASLTGIFAKPLLRIRIAGSIYHKRRWRRMKTLQPFHKTPGRGVHHMVGKDGCDDHIYIQ